MADDRQGTNLFNELQALDSKRHAGLRLLPRTGYRVAAQLHAVPVTMAEFGHAAACFPLVFSAQQENGTGMPVALLGLEPGQNLFVDEQGQWLAGYVPACLRSHPFTLVRPRQGKAPDGADYVVCIDESCDRLARADQGEALFNDDGTPSEALGRVIEFLKQYQLQRELTAQAASALGEAGLLQPMQAKVSLKSGRELALNGFLTVDREALAALGGEVLQALHASGALELAYLHLASLHRFDDLVNRYAKLEPVAAGESTEASVAAGS